MLINDFAFAELSKNRVDYTLNCVCVKVCVMHVEYEFTETEWRIYALVNHTIICSDNCLLPDRRQAITWINVVMLLISFLGTNFSEVKVKAKVKLKRTRNINVAFPCVVR